MYKLLSTAAIALAVSGCENTSTMSGKPSGGPIRVNDHTIEARAQECTNRGFRPGSQKFALCMDRSAEKAVTTAPAPKPRPAEPQMEQAKDSDARPSSGGFMNKIKGMFN